MTLEEQLEVERQKENYDYESNHFTDSILQKGEINHPKAGEDAPKFELPDETGNNVSLDELLKEGPVILSFFKGDFCQYCDLELKALQRSLPQFQKYGAILVGVSPHTVSISYELKTKKNLSYSILSDSGNAIAAAYGLRFKIQKRLMEVFESFGLEDMSAVYGDAGENTNTMPIPGTFVIDQNGKIVYAFVDTDHTKRAEPSDIVATLMSLN